MTSPYEILGVHPGATMDEIKRAYRKKAKEVHPDLHPDDPRANEKMQEVNVAYDMLSNPDKYRAAYQTSSAQRPNPGARTGWSDPGAYQGYRVYTWTTNGAGRDAWHTADARDAWHGADEWNARRAEEERYEWRPAHGFHPFRGAFKLIGGLLAFRFLMTLLRFGFFFW